MEALEALNIATINVVSLAMLGVGGTMYALDVNTVDDLRRLMRRGMGIDGDGDGTPGPSDRQLEQELEEWLATVLDRKMLERKLKEIKEQGQEGEQQQRRTDGKEER